MMAMAKKKKLKKFRKVEAVKALARERVGSVPSSRMIPDRRERVKEKHKITLDKLLEQQE
jgi:hypothetical protein